jgi:hypothetical protein
MKKCKTPGAQFHVVIKPRIVRCDVDIPFALDISKQEAIELENKIHEAMAEALEGYWPRDIIHIEPNETFKDLLEKKLKENRENR